MFRAVLLVALAGCSSASGSVDGGSSAGDADAEVDAFVDGTDSGLCSAAQPAPDGPCPFYGLHCGSHCKSSSPGEHYWTADCKRCFSTLCWEVVSHPCGVEFTDGGF